MAMGGFHGLDPILTPSSLAHLVESGQLRFVMLGDLSPVSRRMGGEVALRPLVDGLLHGRQPALDVHASKRILQVPLAIYEASRTRRPVAPDSMVY